MLLRLMSIAIFVVCVVGSVSAQRVIVQDVNSGRKLTIPANFRETAANRIAALAARRGSSSGRYNDDQLASIYVGRNVTIIGREQPPEETEQKPRRMIVMDVTTRKQYILSGDFETTVANRLPALTSGRGTQARRYSTEQLAAIAIGQPNHRVQFLRYE